MAMRFQLYRRATLRGMKWFWRLRAKNGEIVAQGEGYSRLIDAMRAIALVQSSGTAIVEEPS